MIDPLSDAQVIDPGKTRRPDARCARPIESRRLVTNAAIPMRPCLQPLSILASEREGCSGARAAETGFAGGRGRGPELIHGPRAGGGYFGRVYEAMRPSTLLAVPSGLHSRYSLRAVDALINAYQRCSPSLKPVIQTLHPVATAALPYRDGWRSGSWAGFSTKFTDPPPWYFRTIESWVALLTVSGLGRIEIREPLHPVTQMPASIIFIAAAAG